VSNEAFNTPKPGQRRATPRPPGPQQEPGRRRPIKRAWEVTRERLSQAHLPTPKLKRPSRKAMYWAGGVLAVLAIAIAILIAIWDWNWFRGPIGRYASARMHRHVEITGDLNANIWSWQPWATAEGVTIDKPRWEGAGHMAAFPRIRVQIRLVPLLWGHVDLRELRFDRPDVKLFVDSQGRRNWDFAGRVQKPMALPPIRSFVLRDGKLDYNDVNRKLTFHATLNAHEQLGVEGHGFELTGKGTINSQPFRMEVTGGPLVNIDRNKPYPFDADIRAGDTFVTARGAVPKPFDLGHFYMATTVKGPDMKDLYALTGLALPNTPPYALHGRLSRNDLIWRVDNLGGRVGDSDLAGDVKVTTGRKRPFLEADLRSRSLDFDDLGALIGGPPSTKPGETASPEQRAMAARLDAQQRLFPDATLDFTRIRAMDADVRYKAESIRDAPVRITSGSVRVRLDDGLLRADPIRATLAQGLVQGHVNLNARRSTPVTDLDLRLSNARVEQLVPVRFGGATPLTGSLVGRAKLTGSGNSVHKAFASANGEVMAVVPGGEIRKAFAELMGVNVTKGLGLLLKHDQSTTPIRCAVVHFNTRSGVMTTDSLVFDTGPVLVTGSGTVNLDTERMSFKVRGHDKKFRLVRVLLPVKAEGPIRAPKLGVEPGAAIAQGGIAAGLGALISPLAAMLRFVEAGLAKDANCGALMAGAKADGAPVKTAQLSPAAKR
jgi:uncharacterized protein involved in outer membrane biogenesis